MKQDKSRIICIFLRYLLVSFMVLFGSSIFYILFTQLTVQPVYFFLNFIYGAMLNGSTILVNNFEIEIVGSCVAASAYLLLLILNFSTPNIKPLKRISLLFFSFLPFLLINILRIILFSVLLVNQFQFFDLVHQIFWYGLSTLFVVAIWFLLVKINKIKDIPFYSDLKFLLNFSKASKSKSKKVRLKD